jgi:hypothetical protein
MKELIEAMEMRRKMIIKEKVKDKKKSRTGPISYKDNEDGIFFIEIILPKFRIPCQSVPHTSYILRLRKGDADQ